MKSITSQVLIHILMLSVLSNHSQASETYSDPILVDYIDFTPKIDGVLDKRLQGINKYSFDEFHTFDNPVNNQIKVTYSLAFNESHLYLYIETNANKISYNKRGYLYGDGYKVILGQLKQQGQADEYYDLYYSPSIKMDKWDKGTIGTYNFEHISKPLSNHSQSKAAAHKTSTGFETLIAWKDIHPINPFFMSEIGFNIYFAKFIATENTHGYSVVKDESIWDEEIPERNLAPIKFRLPKTELFTSQIYRKNYQPNQPLELKITPHAVDTEIDVELTSETTDIALNTQLKLPGKNTSKNNNVSIKFSTEVNNMTVGDYILTVSSNGQLIDSDIISILPVFDFHKMLNTIKTSTINTNQSAESTLKFKIKKLQDMIAQLKIYEAATDINAFSTQLEAEINLFQNGTDPYSGITEPYRRAFKSKIDDTLQPYSIKLPENYDANKKYPLLVFLHGSGQDEQQVLNQARGNDQFIELAPLGRDLFKAYALKESQTDIKEAIEDVINHFSVDTNKMIIGGFSMGGYGALRTYYEYPDLFKGVAIFAGHPDLANAWGVAGNHPDFLDKNYSQKFNSIPVFIYHGTSDEAIQFKLAVQLKDALISAGAIVTHSFVDGRGHKYQDEKTNNLYHQWLDQF